MTKTETFIVDAMHCNGCKKTINKALSKNENISSIEADVDTKEVTLSYDEEKIDVEEILSSLDNIGFPATIKKKP